MSWWWFFILLFMVVRAFSKSKSTKKQRPLAWPQMPTPDQLPRKAKVEPVPMQEYKAIIPPVEEKEAVRLVDTNRAKRFEERETVQPVKNVAVSEKMNRRAVVSSPAEGMMWSEVFGPPRAKSSYPMRKRFKR